MLSQRVVVSAFVALGPALCAACGGSATTGSGDAGDGGGSSHQPDGHAPRDATKDATKDAPNADVSRSSCVEGQACGDGGVCAGGACCSQELACGSQCCGSGSICSFGTCAQPGAACVDQSGCASGQYCQYTVAATADAAAADAGTPDATTAADAGILDAAAGDAQCVGGATQPSGVCLPAPPVCPGDAGVPDGGGCIENCQYHPPPAAFTPVLKYAWGGDVTAPYSSDVMMAPVVLPLEDTNCDGKVNAEDIPDIVFSTFANGAYGSPGTLHAISVRGGQLVDRWSAPGVWPSAQLAAGDIDGQPGNEIVGCTMPAGTTVVGVGAWSASGAPLWAVPSTACYMPAIADLDGDGKVEVIAEGGVFDGATGALVSSWNGVAGSAIGNFVISDVDGDGVLDVVTADGAYHADGTRFVTLPAAPATPNQYIENFVAIGDLDKDGKPEVVAVAYVDHTVSVWDYSATAPGNFTWMRQGIDINGTLTQHCGTGTAGTTWGGGPPTIADFDGDGTPDVALAGGIGYAILDGSKIIDASVPNSGVILWTSATTDCSSAETGSSIFDFTGDGKAEAIYSDEEHVRVYDGPTGNVLWSACNTTGTLIEYPLVADVDNDGHADIVVVSNAYAQTGGAEYQCQDTDGGAIAQSGVRVFSDANLAWVRTRSIWNEHAYHVTNVNDDGTIPQNELPNWTQSGLDDFRQNKQPGSEFAAPDGVVSVAPTCTSPFTVAVTVRNIGEAALPAGVVVGVYGGAPPNGAKLGSTTTLIPLYSAQSETLVVTLPGASSSEQVYAVFDDTTAPHPAWHECNVANDTSAPATASCMGPK